MSEKRPLADEIRPLTLDEVVGQKHLLGKGALLRRLLRHYPLAGLILSADGVPAADLEALAGAIGNPPGGRALFFTTQGAGAPALR